MTQSLTNIQLDEKIERHHFFWNREQVDRPLIGFFHPVNETAPGFGLLGESPITPEKIDEDFYQAYRFDFTSMSVRADMPGDLFYTTIPDCGIPWYEVLTGCRIHFSQGTRMAWAEKFAQNLEEFRERWRLPLQTDDPWMDRLRFVLNRKQEDFPSCPIPPVLTRGQLDILFAAVPPEEVLIGLMTDPKSYYTIMHELTDMIVYVHEEQLKILNIFYGGYVNRRGVWAPGRICMTQEDGVNLLSPDIFADRILPGNREIWRQFDYSMIHTHSVALPIMLDALLSAPELKCIESTVDPKGPSVEELLPLWAKIQEAGKCLMICSGLVPDEMKYIKNTLSPAGLAICISTDEPSKYDDLFNSMR